VENKRVLQGNNTSAVDWDRKWRKMSNPKIGAQTDGTKPTTNPRQMLTTDNEDDTNTRPAQPSTIPHAIREIRVICGPNSGFRQNEPTGFPDLRK
jgi:hypothetical protein